MLFVGKKIKPNLIVRALGQKYKTAELALKTVVDSFKGLTGSVGNQKWIGEWEKLEAKAVDQRGEAMMIYNVSPIQGIFHFTAQIKPTTNFQFYSYITGRKEAGTASQDTINGSK